MCILLACAAAATTIARCAFVSNDHGDALQEWLHATAEARAPLAVLHIDAHNDLNVPDQQCGALTGNAPPALVRSRWQRNATLAAKITSAVDLANFQLAAVSAGVVDRIVWVRQSVRRGDARALHTVHRLRFDQTTRSFEDEVRMSSVGSFAGLLFTLAYRQEVFSMTTYDHEAESAALARAAAGGVAFSFHEVPEHELEHTGGLADLLETKACRSTPCFLRPRPGHSRATPHL